MDLTLRPLGRDDIPAWNRLLADVEAVDDTGEHFNEADLAEEMDNPDIELGKDLVGGYDGDRLVGYFAVYPRVAEDAMKIHLSGTVHPDRRGQGIGTRLAEAMVARADEVHAEKCPQLPARLALTGPASNTGQEDLLRRVGLVVERWSFGMRVDLANTPAPGALPGGLELRRYDDSYAAAMHAAHNDAFRDHPNFTPWTDVQWKQWVTGSRNFSPDLSFVVVEPRAPQRVLSYVQTYEFDAYFERTGRREAYVGKVGTLRELRGRGVAGTLLRHCLAAYRDAGLQEASLDVDSENPTGALGVYQGAGFVVERRFADYALVRPPV